MLRMHLFPTKREAEDAFWKKRDELGQQGRLQKAVPDQWKLVSSMGTTYMYESVRVQISAIALRGKSIDTLDVDAVIQAVHFELRKHVQFRPGGDLVGCTECNCSYSKVLGGRCMPHYRKENLHKATPGPWCDGCGMRVDERELTPGAVLV